MSFFFLTSRLPRGIAVGTAALLALTALVTPVQAQVLASNAPLAGASQNVWSQRWFQWAASLPLGNAVNQAQNSLHPGVETNGSRGFLGAQSGASNVFFLSGLFGPAGTTTANRTVTVPQGSFLFFPLINQLVDNTVPINTPLDPPTTFTPDQMLTGAFGVDVIRSFNSATLFASIDGVSVANLNTYRQTVGGAGYNVNYFSADNLNNAGGYDASLGTGVYPSTVLSGSDGYWLAVQPLSVGTHTLTFGGSVNFVDPGGQSLGVFDQNIRYNVVVSSSAAPEPSSIAFAAPLLLGIALRYRRRNRRPVAAIA